MLVHTPKEGGNPIQLQHIIHIELKQTRYNFLCISTIKTKSLKYQPSASSGFRGRRPGPPPPIQPFVGILSKAAPSYHDTA